METFTTARFSDESVENQTGKVLRWVHRYVLELSLSEMGALHVPMLTQLFEPMAEALLHGTARNIFLSDQPWPERAVFVTGNVPEIVPVRTLVDKTRFLVRLLDQLCAGLTRDVEVRLVESFLDYLERFLPERSRAIARPQLSRPRAVGF